jgi:hypothetical protein
MDYDTDRLTALQTRAAHQRERALALNELLQQPSARVHLVAPAVRHIDDVLSLWLPQAAKANTPEVEALALGSAEMFLGLADSILDHAQKMLDTYGSHVVAIG